MVKRIHVVAAVIRGADNRVLIAKRPAHLHMGGLWEFPGGKVEQFESSFEALERELKEEVDITVNAARPLIQIAHDYPDKHVFLDVWEVNEFAGEARGVEGQEINWVTPNELDQYAFPAANAAIVTSAQLPTACFISSDAISLSDYLAAIEAALLGGCRLFILRPPVSCQLSGVHVAEALKSMKHFELTQWQWQRNWREFFETSYFIGANQLSNFGVHFLFQDVVADKIPFAKCLTSSSCANEVELLLAQAQGIDFAVLSSSRAGNLPDEVFLNFDSVKSILEKVAMPVFALTEMGQQDFHSARLAGCQGIAHIGGFSC